jgi:hypothetical protein
MGDRKPGFYFCMTLADPAKEFPDVLRIWAEKCKVGG